MINKLKARKEKIYQNLINLENCSNFGEIFAHPYAFRHMDEETIERVKRSGYKGAIIKNWWGR